MINLQADDFWQFSLNIYAQDDVRQACLRLQDEHRQNVNLLLFILYLFERRVSFGPSFIIKIIDDVLRAHYEIEAFRKNRRRLKEQDMSAYDSALEEELAKEKAFQALLVSSALNHYSHKTKDEIFTSKTQALLTTISLFKQKLGLSTKLSDEVALLADSMLKAKEKSS